MLAKMINDSNISKLKQLEAIHDRIENNRGVNCTLDLGYNGCSIKDTDVELDEHRFALFGGECHYPSGALVRGFISSHDTYTDALRATSKDYHLIQCTNILQPLDWWQIWDCKTNSIIAYNGQPLELDNE